MATRGWLGWMLVVSIVSGPTGHVGAQEGKPSGKEPAKEPAKEARPTGSGPDAAPCCGPHTKVVVPTTVKRKNTRICYDEKEVDYVFTRCARTPIPSHECPEAECGQGGHQESCCWLSRLFGCCQAKGGCSDCGGPVKCGTPHVRHVLIKKIITEEIEVPACKVDRVPLETGCPAEVCAPSSAPTLPTPR